MRIGYPCINLTLPCRGNRTFRLKSYSESRLVETLENNLNCLSQILRYNVEHSILFFRITSDLVPFASHPVCQLNWQNQFRKALKEIGRLINRHKVRISMHPDQFTLINTPDRRVLERSRRELLYHVQVLDLMEVDYQAKVQIHVGGVYGDKAKSVSRFIHRFEMLDAPIQKSDSLHSCPLGHSLLPLIRSTCAPDMVILVNVSILAITSVRYIIARKAVEGKRPKCGFGVHFHVAPDRYPNYCEQNATSELRRNHPEPANEQAYTVLLSHQSSQNGLTRGGSYLNS